MKRMICLSAVALMMGMWFDNPAEAQLKSLFKRNVDADKEKTYWVTDREGPWMIMCASFGGENGVFQANDLVLELREKYNLKAFVYKKKFDYSDKIKGIGWSQFPDENNRVKPVEMRALHSNQIEEIAVLVGNFSSLDDKKAKSTLDKIKYLRPEALHVDSSTQTNQRMGVFREIQRRISGGEMRQQGPMRKAFIIPNPMIPEDYFNQNRVDEYIMKLNKNKGIEFSLLDCPSNYSVRVATFRGESTFKLKEISEMKKEEEKFLKMKKSRTKSQLAEAMEKAHRLTMELRKLGAEAYEFHDRYESFVCVGSFDYAKYKNQEGREIWNQDIIETMRNYQGTIEDFPGLNMKNAVRPKTIPALRGTGIAFDVQPLPVKVPKASINMSRR